MTTADLRLGRWQDVLQGVECDALICDPPYSARTHEGARAITADGIVEGVGQYAHLTDDDVRELVAAWSDRCRGWMVFATDDVIGPVFRDAADAAGRYAFPLLPVLQQQPRVCGDGPSQHGHYLAVSRPRRREFLSWGSLPGWYEAPREKGRDPRSQTPRPHGRNHPRLLPPRRPRLRPVLRLRHHGDRSPAGGPTFRRVRGQARAPRDRHAPHRKGLHAVNVLFLTSLPHYAQTTQQGAQHDQRSDEVRSG